MGIEKIYEIIEETMKKYCYEKIDKLKYQKILDNLYDDLYNCMNKLDDSVIREKEQQVISKILSGITNHKKLIDTDEYLDEFMSNAGSWQQKDYVENFCRCIDIINNTLCTAGQMSLIDHIFLMNIQDIPRKIIKYLESREDKKQNIEVENKLYRGYENYLKLWNSPLFLEDNENEKKLLDVFVKEECEVLNIKRVKYNYEITSNYIKPRHSESSLYIIRNYDEDILNCRTIAHELNDFVKNSKKICMILGHPGNGKSTLVAYLAGEFFKEMEKPIFISLRSVTYKDSLYKTILNYLNVSQEKLENKYIVLDGLDELNTGEPEKILLNFINDIKNGLKNIKIIITMRENYVDIRKNENHKYYIECHIIILKGFKPLQLVDFHKKYLGETISENKLNLLRDDLDIYGVPLILYMAYSLKMNIEKKEDKYKLYERIFSTENGIYDKCNSGNGGYDGVGVQKFNIDDKESFHKISQSIAYTMFVFGCLEAEQEKVDKQIENANYTDIAKKSYLYNNYYNKYNGIISFKHKSFYEYFLAEYICNKMLEIYNSKDKENSIERICNLLCMNKIELEVLQHIKRKICSIQIFNTTKFKDCLKKWIEQILVFGGTYFVTKNLFHINPISSVLSCEANIFFNLLSISNFILIKDEEKLKIERPVIIEYEMSNLKQQCFWKYNILSCLKFEKNKKDRLTRKYDTIMQLEIESIFNNCKFEKENMSYSYFILSWFKDCKFEKSFLKNVNFSNSIFEDVHFINCDLSGADFGETELNSVIFRVRNKEELEGINFIGCDIKNATFDIEFIPILEEQSISLDNVKVRDKKSRNTIITYTEYRKKL